MGKVINIYFQIDDRVTKRGSDFVGTIIDIDGHWVLVKWDEDANPNIKPKICHVKELEKVTEQA